MAINSLMRLSRKLFATDVEQKPTRHGFGEGLIIAGKEDERIVALSADLTESTRVLGFKTAYPERFIQMGVSEQSLAAIAAGLALAGKVPFIASYACFSPGRNWEQIRTTICLPKTNVKIMGAHAGVSVGPDGATHQMTEDLALMRVLPNMTVLVPCDAIETRKATLAAAQIDGPVYIRFARSESPVFTTDATPFAVGQAQVFRKGTDVAIIACGILVHEALLAARSLEKLGLDVRVINCPSIKPLDEATIIAAAKDCGAIVTVEEAQAAGGLGSAICELLSSVHPVPIERIGLQDDFGQSGTPRELLEHYHLTAPWIAKAVQKVIKRKVSK